MPPNPVFDRLYADAVPALLAGDHRQDEPPVDGGRWPVSVVGIPDEPAREVLAGVMREALTFTGPGHFETGRSDASHLTVRAWSPTETPPPRRTPSRLTGSRRWRRWVASARPSACASPG